MIPLPIDDVLPELVRAVQKARAAVVVAPPGAGKTTRVPPAILAAKLLAKEHPNLVMLQPRRVAARAAAERIAQENHWELGKEVGYHIRFERRLAAATHLRVITEGILTRQLMADPFLEGVGAVILDEFHERSLHTDLAIALLREVRRTVRSDLILIVMSATMAAEPVAAFLDDCPIVSSAGRLFDVAIEHRAASTLPVDQRVGDEARAAAARPREETGDILAFLPGAREIDDARQRLSDLRDALVLPLHGSLPFPQQVRAIQPADERKIILATNIAETSLTIPGVRTVIDSGLARQAVFDARRGLDQLLLTRISRASAVQRAGRAGRVAAGRCIRLWTAKEEAAMPDFDLPEIHRIDLSATVLALHAWGKQDVLNFGWYERPQEKSLRAAERLLWMLGALENEHITPLGRRMMDLPVHPRLARLLIAAADEGLADEGATLAALLSEPEFAPAPPVQGPSDLLIRLDRGGGEQASRLAKDLRRTIGHVGHRRVKDIDSALLKLALLAYPDRVARRRERGDTAVMVGGGGLRLARESVVKTAEYFIAVEARHDDRAARGEALVRIASAIEPTWLEECFPNRITRKRTALFDESRGRVVGLTQTLYLDLVLSEGADAAVDADEAAKLLAEHLRPMAEKIVREDESAGQLLARIEFLRKWMPEHPWPVLDAAQIVEAACAGKRAVDEVKGAALTSAIMSDLRYPLDRLFDEHAPASLELPSGKRAKLQYDPGRPPVLSVRLQDLFGWRQTPRLAAGRATVLLELLGPNYRPVQITDDLASFWKNTYERVRKDLRRRYPKHSWPEDPSAGRPRR